MVKIERNRHKQGRYQIVNEKGLKQIHDILAKRHKLGGDWFGPAELQAWAADVENHLLQGNGACFEIRSVDTVSGHTENFTLDNNCIEWRGEDQDNASI